MPKSPCLKLNESFALTGSKLEFSEGLSGCVGFFPQLAGLGLGSFGFRKRASRSCAESAEWQRPPPWGPQPSCSTVGVWVMLLQTVRHVLRVTEVHKGIVGTDSDWLLTYLPNLAEELAASP